MSLPAAVSSLRCRSRSRGRGWDDLEEKDDYGPIGKPCKEIKHREIRCKPRGSFPTTSTTKRKEEDGEPLTPPKEKTELAEVAKNLAEVAINEGHSEAKKERSFEELVTYYVDKIPSCNMLCWHRLELNKGFVPVPARICAVKKVPSQAMIDDLGFLKGGKHRVVPTSELLRYSGCSQKKRWCPKLMKEYLEYISRYGAATVRAEEAFLRRILQDVKAKEHEESDVEHDLDDKCDTVGSGWSKSYDIGSRKKETLIDAEARDDPLRHPVYRDEPRQERESQIIQVDNHGLDSTTWWEINPKQLKRGATPLVNRCIRAYGWSELFALRVLEGYKQFLTWKKSFEDWDGLTLSPSLPIKMMWQQHLLDSHNYQSDCMLLFGNLMHYDPDGEFDSEAETERIENTRRLAWMRYRGGDLDEQVWHWEEKKTEKPAHHAFSLDIASSSSTSDLQSVDKKDIICLRIIGGFKKGLRSATITMQSSDDFQTIFEEYASEYAVRVGKLVSLRFLTKSGQRIADTDTPKKLGLKSNDEILVVQMESVEF